LNEFKSGFVHVLGRANVGKSTFINGIMGEKINITSEKPQTTRNRVRCIYEEERGQIVFLDTPGFYRTVDALSKKLLGEARKALKGSDIILYMVEPWGEVSREEGATLEKLAGSEGLKMLLVNKIDKFDPGRVAETLAAYSSYGEREIFEEYIPVSALAGDGLGLVLDKVFELLPEGERLFPEGTKVDRPLEFLVAEFVREKVYQLTYQEIPYSVAARTREIDKREGEGLVEIYVDLYVTRQSQKGILIGKGGSMIKEIGRQAREDLEDLLGVKVYLDLKVKVERGWKEDEGKVEKLNF